MTAVAFAPSVGANTNPLAAPAEETGGVLDWGIKESFRDYVEGPIADGEITMTPPATRNDDGTFRFPDGVGVVDPDAGTAMIDLAGGVFFEGHDQSLQLWVERLRLEVSDGSGVIVADVRTGTEDYPGVRSRGVRPRRPEPRPRPGRRGVPGRPGDDLDRGGRSRVRWVLRTRCADGSLHVHDHDRRGSDVATPDDEHPADPSTPPTSTTPPTTTETPPPPPDPSPSATWEEGEVSSGRLDWGVKESFRSYIAGPIADGGWTLEGITESDGRFHWTASFGEYDMDDAAGSVGFIGGVRFTGHEGSLDIKISRPRVRFAGGDNAVLVVDVRSKSLEGEEYVEQTSVDFATLDLDPASSEIGDDTVSYAGIPATLTAAGAAGFGGFYEAGTELDPVTIAFAVGGAEVPGGGSAGGPGGLAGTGSGDVTTVLGGLSAALLLLGGGLLVAARRLRVITP